MFSAVRFVIAAAIVALFGGFVLVEVATRPRGDEPFPGAASPSPTASETVLSGMVTEEVEPGVFRILDDGAGHDLMGARPVGVTVAADGSVWLLWPARIPDLAGLRYMDVGALIELGREGTFPFEPASRLDLAAPAVGSDGVAWMNLGATLGSGDFEPGILASLDGSTWSQRTWPDGSTDVGVIETGADGAIWLTQQEFVPASQVARIVDGEWTVLPALTDPSLAGFFEAGSPPRKDAAHGDGPGGGDWRRGYLAASADGTAWLAGGGHHSYSNRIPAPIGLLHFDGTRWEAVDLPTDGQQGWIAGPLAIGSEGTLWVYLEKGGQWNPIGDATAGHLARLDADGWRLFTATADGVPKLTIRGYDDAAMVIDGAGTLWVGTLDYGGVLAFDGSGWRRYLDGLDVNRLGVAPDGSVFATALYGCHAPSSRGSTVDEATGSPVPIPGAVECWPYDLDLSRAGLYVITPGAAGVGE